MIKCSGKFHVFPITRKHRLNHCQLLKRLLQVKLGFALPYITSALIFSAILLAIGWGRMFYRLCNVKIPFLLVFL